MAAQGPPPPPVPGSVQATFRRFPLLLTSGGWLALAWVAHLVDIEPDAEMRCAFAGRLCDIVRHAPLPVEEADWRWEIAAAIAALLPDWPTRPALSPERQEVLFWLSAVLPKEAGIDASIVAEAVHGGFEVVGASRRPSD